MRYLHAGIFFILFGYPAFGAEQACNANDVRERMIEAKGGREKLYSINALLVRKEYTWTEFLRKRRLRSTTLYEFPDFFWSFFENGDPRFGSNVTEHYLDKGYEEPCSCVRLTKLFPIRRSRSHIPFLSCRRCFSRPSG